MHTESDVLVTPRSDPFGGNIAIHLEDISVCYRLPKERSSGIKEFAIRWVQRRIQYNEFWALRGVSLDIVKGETFGIIGLNGAGKSTLLKVVARVLRPTKGRVVVLGTVAPLLELGAGFHTELTGRENVFLNGTLLGHSRAKMETLFGDIVDFAEMWDFIDAPIRTYSTGMVARLGFSVATCTVPDILIVDEILSVGDAPFQEKCLKRMQQFQDQGTTILFVSHSMSSIKDMCQRAAWLLQGRIQDLGPADSVVDQYIKGSAYR